MCVCYDAYLNYIECLKWFDRCNLSKKHNTKEIFRLANDICGQLSQATKIKEKRTYKKKYTLNLLS